MWLMSWFRPLRQVSLLGADQFHSLVNSAMDPLPHTREGQTLVLTQMGGILGRTPVVNITKV